MGMEPILRRNMKQTIKVPVQVELELIVEIPEQGKSVEKPKAVKRIVKRRRRTITRDPGAKARIRERLEQIFAARRPYNYIAAKDAMRRLRSQGFANSSILAVKLEMGIRSERRKRVQVWVKEA
jgi:hypothetical protein